MSNAQIYVSVQHATHIFVIIIADMNMHIYRNDLI